jgi:LPXTG-motif cell wall-anchored protein
MKKKLTALAAGVAAFGLMASPVAAEDQTIAQIASGNEAFSTLVAAASAAGLVGAIDSCDDAPVTVFAPTNDAFAAALASLNLTAEQLLADTELLTSVLTYHIVSGSVTAEQVVGLTSATTLNGAAISIAVVGEGVVLNGNVNVVQTDILACNGVIHVIDGVLLPPAPEPETRGGGLPPTGSDNTVMALLALLAVAGGAAMVVVSRRRVTA